MIRPADDNPAPAAPAGANTAPDAGPSNGASALLDFVRERDVPCPLCGYNLRGLPDARCPECGRELKLSVGLAEPFLKAWITLAAALLLPAGIGLLFAIMIVRQGLPTDEPGISAILVLFVAFIPFAAAALWWRRRLLKLRHETQWALAVAAILSATTAFLLFITQVR